MKASEVLNILEDLQFSFALKAIRSTVDETKSLFHMLEYWKQELGSHPNANVGSIIKYNITKDFPHAFRNNADSSRSRSRLSGVK